jgi:hypothetical protein
MDFRVEANFGELKALRADIRRAVPRLLFAATSRAVQLTKREAKGGEHGRIAKGVTKDFDRAATPARGMVVAEAVVKRKAQRAVLHLPSGKTKDVELLGGRAVNVAELAASGTGLYGPRGQEITPRRSGVLLIGVDSVPSGNAFIAAVGEHGGKFILRPRSRGVPPDDYPDRAADALEDEVDEIAGRVLVASGVL